METVKIGRIFLKKVLTFAFRSGILFKHPPGKPLSGNGQKIFKKSFKRG